MPLIEYDSSYRAPGVDNLMAVSDYEPTSTILTKGAVYGGLAFVGLYLLGPRKAAKYAAAAVFGSYLIYKGING